MKELTIPRHERRHDVDATKVSMPNDDVTKIFDILLSVAMHYGNTFITPLTSVSGLFPLKLGGAVLSSSVLQHRSLVLTPK